VSINRLSHTFVIRERKKVEMNTALLPKALPVVAEGGSEVVTRWEKNNRRGRRE
jgi:hypothetical protein